MLSGRPLRVLVVDDDARFRALLLELLTGAGFDVVGVARDGAEGVQLAAELHPDVVTMDLEMPRLNGVEATRAIAALPSPPRVVVVSGSGSSELMADAAAAGAASRVAKSEVETALVPALAGGVALGAR